MLFLLTPATLPPSGTSLKKGRSSKFGNLLIKGVVIYYWPYTYIDVITCNCLGLTDCLL